MIPNDAVEAATHALVDNWKAMHTNEALGYQRMLARRALWAASPFLVAEIIDLMEEHPRVEQSVAYDYCPTCFWDESSVLTYNDHILKLLLERED